MRSDEALTRMHLSSLLMPDVLRCFLEREWDDRTTWSTDRASSRRNDLEGFNINGTPIPPKGGLREGDEELPS